MLGFQRATLYQEMQRLHAFFCYKPVIERLAHIIRNIDD